MNPYASSEDVGSYLRISIRSRDTYTASMVSVAFKKRTKAVSDVAPAQNMYDVDNPLIF